MNSEFFITIPSNTPFDGNTTSNFTARLPEKIQLDGNWEVALVEMLYPHSWKNIHGYDGKASDLGDVMQPNSFLVWIHKKLWLHCLVAPNYYGNMKKLVMALETGLQTAIISQKERILADGVNLRNTKVGRINILEMKILKENEKLELIQSEIDKEQSVAVAERKNPLKLEKLEHQKDLIIRGVEKLQEKLGKKKANLEEWHLKLQELVENDIVQSILNDVRFQYNAALQQVNIALTNTKRVTALTLSPTLAYMLGFKNDGTDNVLLNTRINAAPYPPDMRAGFYALYVYCSLVENQIVADHKVPLLRAVHVEGDHGDIREKIFHSPHYVPVIGNEFETVEIDIKDDRNQSVHFDFGKVIVKLHFRKKRSFLL